MPPRFHALSLAEFDELVDQFEFRRRIEAVHMHHTWRPRHADFRGEATIEAMWRFHTVENGWSDIAQHVTIDPDGIVWTGRDWNSPPASARGFNGTSVAGPFMFEVIGDFDTGEDVMSDRQREAAVHVIAKIWDRFGLPASSLRFHHEMSAGKSCPGSALQKSAFVADAEAKLGEMRDRRRALHSNLWASGDSSPSLARTRLVASEMGRSRVADRGMDDDELPESGRAYGRYHGGRAVELRDVDAAALRPHVVNLHDGQFSTGGAIRSDAQQVAAIFERHLPEWWADHASDGQPLRIMVWAHGGLVPESSGIAIAQRQIEWWKRNGVYPIHFVWETGIEDAIRQRVFGPSQRGLEARDLADHTSDPIIEGIARGVGAGSLWTAMKRSAELASANGGGARRVAEHLADFCRRNASLRIEVYAAGHSAGSIFHAHLLPALTAVGGPRIEELFLLAPAIRTDLFKQKLLPLVGDRIRRMSMFTMSDALERGDSVGFGSVAPYRKSLLYLVSRALEEGGIQPLLGLDSSLRADADLRRFFGLDGGGGRAEVVWSDGSPAASPRRSSTSRSHGGFDDDVPTMNSIARRVVGRDSIVGFDEVAKTKEVSMPPHSEEHPRRRDDRVGRRLAVCVGVDDYPDPSVRLSGCVSDARAWAGVLGQLGFDVRDTLTDSRATRKAILDSLADLVGSSRAGDVVVFQFSGHGTQLPDLDGDEDDDQDEAFLPYDYATGSFIIDDDLWDVFRRIPADVNFTCFFDCCHSGTITRVFEPTGRSLPPPGARKRFVAASSSMIAAHRSFRERAGRGATPPHGKEDSRSIVFSACQPREVAYEVDGHGEFTVRATKILRGGIRELSNEDFEAAVVEAFGPKPSQNPMLDCAERFTRRALLQPLDGDGTCTEDRGDSDSTSPPGGGDRGRGCDVEAISRVLRRIADVLDERR